MFSLQSSSLLPHILWWVQNQWLNFTIYFQKNKNSITSLSKRSSGERHLPTPQRSESISSETISPGGLLLIHRKWESLEERAAALHWALIVPHCSSPARLSKGYGSAHEWGWSHRFPPLRCFHQIPASDAPSPRRDRDFISSSASWRKMLVVAAHFFREGVRGDRGGQGGGGVPQCFPCSPAQIQNIKILVAAWC